MKRNSTVVWQGTGKEGKGSVSLGSGTLTDAQYSYKSRFEEGVGTNPEELVAAAHAGCFAMKLSFLIVGAGFEAEKLEATCEINFEAGEIKYSHIVLDASVPGIDQATFDNAVSEAERDCPISKLLNTEIKVTSSLNT